MLLPIEKWIDFRHYTKKKKKRKKKPTKKTHTYSTVNNRENLLMKETEAN